jgi:hypothetical protein
VMMLMKVSPSLFRNSSTRRCDETRVRSTCISQSVSLSWHSKLMFFTTQNKTRSLVPITFLLLFQRFILGFTPIRVLILISDCESLVSFVSFLSIFPLLCSLKSVHQLSCISLRVYALKSSLIVCWILIWETFKFWHEFSIPSSASRCHHNHHETKREERHENTSWEKAFYEERERAHHRLDMIVRDKHVWTQNFDDDERCSLEKETEKMWRWDRQGEHHCMQSEERRRWSLRHKNVFPPVSNHYRHRAFWSLLCWWRLDDDDGEKKKRQKVEVESGFPE